MKRFILRVAVALLTPTPWSIRNKGDWKLHPEAPDGRFICCGNKVKFASNEISLSVSE